jgi:hypothetical protein
VARSEICRNCISRNSGNHIVRRIRAGLGVDS